MSRVRTTVWADPRAHGVVASMMATIVANLPVFLVGATAVRLQADLGFGDQALGLAVGAYYASGAVVSSRAGRLVARLGARTALRNAAIMSAGTLVATSLLAHRYAVLVLLMALGGIANSLAQPASNVYLVRIVPARRLGVALGLQKSAIPAAALLGGLAVPLAQGIGWRWVFVIGAILGALTAFTLPQQAAAATPQGAPPSAAASRPDVSTRHLMVLALGVGLGSSASNSLSAFTVRGGVEAQLSEGSAAVLLVIGSLLGIVLRLAFGARADRRPGRALRSIAVLFVAASATFGLLAFENRALFALGVPLAFATAYAWPGLFHLAVVRANPTAPGVATGIAMTGTLAGAVLGPSVFGIVAESVSFTAAWLTGAGILLAAAVIVTWSVPHVREVPAAPTPVS